MYHSDPVELVPVDRNVRRRTDSRHRSPETRVNSSIETPTKTALRAEIAARDSFVSALRGQLIATQCRAVNTIQAQQDGFAQAVHRHEEQSRLLARSEAQRVHDSHEERIMALSKQENEAQLQIGLLESNLVAAQGQVLASTSVLNSQDAAMSELERAAYDRVGVLEAEVRDAVNEASFVQRERDELVKAENIRSEPELPPASRPLSFTPASPLYQNDMDHVQHPSGIRPSGVPPPN